MKSKIDNHFKFSTLIFSGVKETSFLAPTSDQNFPSFDIIRWNVNYDNGNNYDLATGGYTALVDGIYQFNVALIMEGDWSSVYFHVDTLPVMYCWTRASTVYSGVQTNCTVTISLKAGQIVQIKTNSVGKLDAQGTTALYSWFSGHLLFPK